MYLSQQGFVRDIDYSFTRTFIIHEDGYPVVRAQLTISLANFIHLACHWPA